MSTAGRASASAVSTRPSCVVRIVLGISHFVPPYLFLPLFLVTRDMPAIAIRAPINMHRYAGGIGALAGNEAGIGLGKIKILFLTVFTAARTHVISSPLDTWNP